MMLSALRDSQSINESDIASRRSSQSTTGSNPFYLEEVLETELAAIAAAQDAIDESNQERNIGEANVTVKNDTPHAYVEEVDESGPSSPAIPKKSPLRSQFSTRVSLESQFNVVPLDESDKDDDLGEDAAAFAMAQPPGIQMDKISRFQNSRRELQGSYVAVQRAPGDLPPVRGVVGSGGLNVSRWGMINGDPPVAGPSRTGGSIRIRRTRDVNIFLDIPDTSSAQGDSGNGLPDLPPPVYSSTHRQTGEEIVPSYSFFNTDLESSRTEACQRIRNQERKTLSSKVKLGFFTTLWVVLIVILWHYLLNFYEANTVGHHGSKKHMKLREDENGWEAWKRVLLTCEVLFLIYSIVFLGWNQRAFYRFFLGPAEVLPAGRDGVIPGFREFCAYMKENTILLAVNVVGAAVPLLLLIGFLAIRFWKPCGLSHSIGVLID